MDINEIMSMINRYRTPEQLNNMRICETQAPFVTPAFVTDGRIEFSNRFIDAVEFTSSNSHEDYRGNREKMWSIIVSMKEDFSHLATFRELSRRLDIRITPVRSGKNKGCFGIRIYNMYKNPDRDIIMAILEYIFQ